MQKISTVLPLVILTLCSIQATSHAAPVESAVAKTEEITKAEKALWMTDFEKAKALSKKSGKPVFALFTGSDWCGWCVALHNEVFSKSEFVKYAGDSLVLFEADFPRKKKLSDAEKKQNQELAEKYGIRGFPTVLILDADGVKIAETGYQAGGPKLYVDHVKSLLKSGK